MNKEEPRGQMTITKKPCPMCGSKMVYVDENGKIVKKKKTALAENLRQILSDEGITVAMLAEWSGVSVGTIRGWLYYDRVAKKHSPSLKRVADVLRVSVEELRGRKEPEVEG